MTERKPSREKSLLGLICFYVTDAIADLKFQIDDPNDRNYVSEDLGTWSSVSDVDIFLSRFNHSTAYKDGTTKLRVGNYVTINDGTYNTIWKMAGFDLEHNQTAADGTVYDNGYGICLIPHTLLGFATWNESNTLTGAYKSSAMHTSHLPNIMSKLQNVLGSHIVTRNVLLSSSINSSAYSNAYTWTTSQATLMSVGQMTGTFASNRNKYDDGEANYKLPLFNNEDFKMGSGLPFWTRGIYGGSSKEYYIWFVNDDGNLNGYGPNGSRNVRPLIYIR